MAAHDKKLVHVLRPASGAIQFAAKPVIVKVGRPAIVFHVDEQRLSEASEFFKAALKKEWRSGQTRIVELPEEDPTTFNVYVNWLYSGLLFLDIDSDEHRTETEHDIRLIDAYALGDILMDADFKDAVSDAFIANLEIPAKDAIYLPHPKSRAYLYEKTAADSKLRQAFVHRVTSRNPSKHVDENDCTAYLVDIARKQAENDKECALVAAIKCRFHEHAEGAEHCYRSKQKSTAVEGHSYRCPRCS